MRYQIVYIKRGFPLTTWANSADRAHQLAEQLRRGAFHAFLGRYFVPRQRGQILHFTG